MSWETLTTDDALALFNDSERDAFNAAKGDTGDAGLASAVSFVVGELREAISGRDISLGPDGSIPSGFKKRAIGAVRWQFLMALPAGKSLMTDDRKAANESYEKLVEGIQDGTIKVVPGAGGPAMALPKIKPHDIKMSERQQEGL